jgi:hypothetical protein
MSAGGVLWGLGSSQDWPNTWPVYIHPSKYYDHNMAKPLICLFLPEATTHCLIMNLTTHFTMRQIIHHIM